MEPISTIAGTGLAAKAIPYAIGAAGSAISSGS